MGPVLIQHMPSFFMCEIMQLINNTKEIVEIPFAYLLPAGTSTLPPEFVQLAENIGVTSIQDKISLQLSPGLVIFDIYNSLVERPKAPLAAELENRKRMELAHFLTQDGPILPDDILTIVQKAMSDDSLWKKVIIYTNCHTKNSGNNIIELPLSSEILNWFPQTRNTLIGLFA